MPIDVKIRAAQPEDADRLIDFNLRMARETEDRQLDPGVLTAVFADNATFCLKVATNKFLAKLATMAASK